MSKELKNESRERGYCDGMANRPRHNRGDDYDDGYREAEEAKRRRREERRRKMEENNYY